MPGPHRILFVCVENACRSQMAEGFARHYGGDHVIAVSAGSRPRGRVDETAMAAMREKGISLDAHVSKGFAQLPNQTWDVVVTMGCGDACPQIPAKKRLDWTIPNPAWQPLDGYRQIRDLIEQRVRELLEELDRGACDPS